MARWREVSEDLRRRILAGEFPAGSRLPTLSELQKQYRIAGMNSIRLAQSPLIDEGLLETQPGVGVFVVSTIPRPAGRVDVLAELRQARAAIDRAIALVEQADLP